MRNRKKYSYYAKYNPQHNYFEVKRKKFGQRSNVIGTYPSVQCLLICSFSEILMSNYMNFKANNIYE